MSEVRASINGLADDAPIEEVTALKTEYQGLETRYQALLLVGEDEEVKAGTDTPEERELGRLQARASIFDYASEAAFQTTLVGASLEFRDAVLGAGQHGYMPLDMLIDPATEYRVDAQTSVSAIERNQLPIAPRVFNRSSVDYLGVATPTVPVGTNSYPRLSSGTTADVRSEGVELDGTAAALTTVAITPHRLTASYTVTVESLVKVSGFEEALRADIQSVLQDKRDSLAINGQSAVSNTSPAITGVISSLTNPTNPTAVAAWDDYVTAFDDSVDGKYALSDSEVRLLVNVETWKHAMGLQIAASGDLLRDRLPRDRFRASANMPATATTIATALAYASGAQARGFLMPTWRGVQLIIDPYSNAKKGERILTAIMILGFNMVDSAAYRRIEFKVS